RYCDVGQWELTLPARSAMADLLAQPGSGIVVSYRGEVIFSGPMDYTEYTSNSDGDWLRKYSGPCDNVILADMLLWPNAIAGIDGKGEAHELNNPPYRNLTTYVYLNSSMWTGVASRRRDVAHGGLYVKGAYP